MKEFIFENGDTIIIILACLLDLILFLIGFFKKKQFSPLGQVFVFLPVWIKKVEESFGAGSGMEKKAMVMDLALKAYRQLTGVNVSADSYIAKEISNKIEAILETPMKKGK